MYLGQEGASLDGLSDPEMRPVERRDVGSGEGKGRACVCIIVRSDFRFAGHNGDGLPASCICV